MMKSNLNINKSTILLLLSINMVATVSCNKEWLDEKSRQDIAIPATLKDFQALLDNANTGTTGDMNGNSPSLGQIASDDSYITDAAFSARSERERNAYTWSKQFPYILEYGWVQSYERIAVCNIILEDLEKIRPVSSSEQQSFNDIKGQALFQRSRTFYELAQIWSPPYVPGTSNASQSIPLRLESDLNIRSKQSTVQETYDRIINDLLLAKDLLPQKTYVTRASKVAVDALLSRIYLSMEEYTKAFEHADFCLTAYKELLQFKDEVNTGLAVPFVPESNKEIIFYSMMFNYPSMGSQARIAQEFKNLYTDNDLRKTAFFGASAGLNTFKGNYTGSATGRFNGLATDEILLIRAECYARANKSTEAMKDLNDLLITRWNPNATVPALPYISLVASDSEDALRKVLLERRKELLMRGLRWSDLRRLNRDPRFRQTIRRTVAGITYTLEPDSYKYTFPIPDDIIQITGFTQNPQW